MSHRVGQKWQIQSSMVMILVLAIGLHAPTFTPTVQGQSSYPLRDLNSYFPFSPPQNLDDWSNRKKELRNQLLVSLGLYPLPEKKALNPTIHGKIDLGDYSIEKVYFDNQFGLHVTGLLYKPTELTGKVPGILCPHGHFPDGRFGKVNDGEVKKDQNAGAEVWESNARNKIQTRAANLAKMGCVVFVYDMMGYADSQQIPNSVAHRFVKQRNGFAKGDWGLFSPRAELELQNVMGLQTWNSIRALDFLRSLPNVDTNRIGVTGASGGGTQTFILCALDDRIDAAFPAVMVSTAMQGGCTCENCCYLRIGTGNVEFAAMFAPKPLGLTAANDWTKEMESKGYPELSQLYGFYGKPENVELTARLEFGHNYNQVSREAMYRWFKSHLNFAGDPIETEVEFIDRNRLSVYDQDHPRPVGGDNAEAKILKSFKSQSDRKLGFQNTNELKSTLASIEVFVRLLEKIGRETDGVSISVDSTEGLEHSTYRNRHGGTHQLKRIGKTKPRTDTTIVLIHSDSEQNQAAWSEYESSDPFSILSFENQALPDKNRLQSARVSNSREVLAYTVGYNAPQVVRRANAWVDVIASLDGDVVVVATGTGVPEVCINARRLAKMPNVKGIAIASNGFRFGKIDQLRDPNLLPGATKYHDLPGMLALAAPKPMLLLGETPQTAKLTKLSYAQAGAPEALTLEPNAMTDTSSLLTQINRWLGTLRQ